MSIWNKIKTLNKNKYFKKTFFYYLNHSSADMRFFPYTEFFDTCTVVSNRTHLSPICTVTYPEMRMSIRGPLSPTGRI